METKICSKCKRELTVDCFYSRKDRKSGLSSWCKYCSRQHKVNNKENIKEKSKKYRLDNKEKISLKSKEYYNKNKESISLKSKEHYNKNKGSINKRNSRNYYKNKCYYREKHSQHYYENKSYYRMRDGVRARKISNRCLWGKEMVLKIYKLCSNLNKFHGYIKYHVDHIYPIKGKTCSGLHVPENLRIITATENLMKGNKIC